MKLYDCPSNVKIRVMDKEGDIIKDKDGEDMILDFRHVDVAFSVCYDKTGHPVYIPAWSDVEVLP
jgi:6-pyruvoyl-tetrahydropterin synthase